METELNNKFNIKEPFAVQKSLLQGLSTGKDQVCRSFGVKRSGPLRMTLPALLAMEVNIPLKIHS